MIYLRHFCWYSVVWNIFLWYSFIIISFFEITHCTVSGGARALDLVGLEVEVGEKA